MLCVCNIYIHVTVPDIISYTHTHYQVFIAQPKLASFKHACGAWCRNTVSSHKVEAHMVLVLILVSDDSSNNVYYYSSSNNSDNTINSSYSNTLRLS